MQGEIFKALGSKTRVAMIKCLLHREYHVSGLARALGISVPVAAKHVKILENVGVVESEVFGKTHVLRVNRNRLYEAMDTFSDEYDIEVEQGASLLSALKEVAGVGLKRVADREYIVSIDNEEGFYVYEVNGKLPDTPINEYKLDKVQEIEIKRLVSVVKKKVRVKVSANAKIEKKQG